MNEDIATIVRQKGLLIQKDLFDLLGKFGDIEVAKSFLDNLEMASGQKMITSSSLSKNTEYVLRAVNNLPGDMKQLVETTFVRLGVSVEVKKSSEIVVKSPTEPRTDYQLFYANTAINKKIQVSDFVGHFRSRYQQIQRILMQRPDVQQLVSINKIAGERQKFSIIGMVTSKRVTSNKNLIITLEDLTGKITALVKAQNECFSKASELQLDDVVAVKASGNNEIIFVQDIIFPDSFKEKTLFKEDVCVAFISDIHTGSAKHLGIEFQRFLDWLKTDQGIAKKIRYLFVVGDNVDGTGVFPGQEKGLFLKSLHEQYAQLAKYMAQVPEYITIFMCPGQHDSVRIAEPQPIIDNFYGEPLYGLKNLVLVPNPTLVKLIEDDKEFKVLMYHGASIHPFINEIEELRTLKAHRCPAKAVKHMLKRRHLAPMHGLSTSIVYVPNAEKDPMVITEVPDVLCTGEVHRLDVETYNGVLILTGSCWQSQTDFEEKVGNIPDPCKVPVLNLRTRELKILDFNADEH